MAGIVNDMTAFLSQKGYDSIPIIQNTLGLLLITAKVNGIEGLFILDTGAGISVIDTKQADHLLLLLQKDNASYTGAGAGARGIEVIPSTGNKLEIGNRTVSDLTFCAMTLDHANQAMSEAGANEEILGIIGVDILKPAKAIIYYGTMTLYLLSGNNDPNV